MRPTAAGRTSNPWALALWTAAISVALMSATANGAEDNPAQRRPKAEAPLTAERIVVKFRGASGPSIQASPSRESAASLSANAAADTARMNALGSRRGFTVQSSRALGGNLHMMRVTPNTSNETPAETLARLRADSDVEFAEIDRRVYPHAISNDPLAAGQWFLQSAQPAAINANAAWDITKGSSGVVIAVVDTGVRFEHPDLGRASGDGRFLPGYDFVSGDSGSSFRTANDGNGREGDASDPGDWVVASDDCDVPDSDSSWHGTRVSGIIGAKTNSASGVAGILWDGFILPVRVLGKCGGFNSDVLAGIRWAAGLSVPGVPANPYPAQVINVSLGGEGACDAASAQVINEVASAGVLIVVSAGNEGGPVDSPANCAGAMGVVGLRQAGTKVGFSSLGPQIAIGAPGGNCVNTTGGPCLFSIDTTTNAGATTPGAAAYTNQFDINVGTSFSSPIVSGIAGLMLAVNGNLKSKQLIQRMQAGASKPFPTTSETPSLPTCHVPTGPSDVQAAECVCTTSTCGAGMANALGAVNEALRPIAAIQAPASVTPGGNVNLQGGGSSAACARSISSYQWAIVNGAPVVLTNTNTATASLQAPTSGSALIRLTVTDNAGKTDSADITVSSTTTSTAAPSNAGAKACLTATVPPAGITITATDPTAAEASADQAIFTVSRSGGTASALLVPLAIGGTAINGSDYQTIPSSVTIPAGATSATVTITPIDDAALEGMETVTLAAVAGTGLEVDASSQVASMGIADNDSSAPVTIAATDANASEGNSDLGVFTITRTGSTAGALVVNLSFSGVATSGTDYQSPRNSVTIPAGATTATVTITPTDDGTVEGSETVVASIVDGANYTIDAPASATVTIADNDSAASASASGGDGDGGGGALDVLTLLFALSVVMLGARRRRPSIAGRLGLQSGTVSSQPPGN
jgi:serine protease